MKNKNKRELEKHWAEQARKLSKQPPKTAVRHQLEDVKHSGAPATQKTKDQ